MLQKRDYVRYAGEGGLYLWDNECHVRWHNLSDSDRTDWLLFFDACREEPTAFTEAIIAAIMNGLCPHKTTAIFEKTSTGYFGWGAQEGRDWAAAKFWYLRESRTGFGKDSVPEFTRKPAPFFLGQRTQWTGGIGNVSHRVLRPIIQSYQWGTWSDFRRRAWKVHRFTHPYDGWRFLFQFM